MHEYLRIRRPFPDRALHLVDIENLAGTPVPSLVQVSEVRARYLTCPGLGPGDHAVLAASHLGLLNAALGWPRARYRIRSGKDGADLELLDVLEHENAAARFSRVVIGSGDGIFAGAAVRLAALGVPVTVVSRRAGLAPGLARAAGHVIYLDSRPRAPSSPSATCSQGASGRGPAPATPLPKPQANQPRRRSAVPGGQPPGPAPG
jgi:hypothetical protein